MPALRFSDGALVLPHRPMKSMLCLAIISTALATAATGSQAPTKAVIAAEQARRAALLSGDASAVAAVLADDLRYIHSNGKLEDKQAVVDGLASKAVAYERFELSGLEPRPITEDVVVLTGTIDQRKRSSGKWSELRLLFHAVWRNESGVWRLVSLQTVLPPAPAAGPVTKLPKS